MISLLGMNTFYLLETHNAGHNAVGVYPVSVLLADLFANMSDGTVVFWHHFNWWSHILLIFYFFANVLPYSKHFHVFMSVPNVFVSRIEPLGKVDNMESITKEVKLMLDPSAPMDAAAEEPIEKFGVSDANDVNWVNYMNCAQLHRVRKMYCGLSG